MSAAAVRKVKWTEAEYLSFENKSPTKHEFYDGELYALAGANGRHNRVCARVIAALVQLVGRGDCEVFPGDQRISIPAATLRYTYADAGIQCGEPIYDENDDEEMSLVNPIVLVEVLSPSTRSYDRGEKLSEYKLIESLQDVLLIEPGFPQVEHHHRGARGGWKLTTRRRGSISLLGGVVALEDLYPAR